MQTHQRIAALKKLGRKHSSPVSIRGLIDTGASCSAIDPRIVQALDLDRRGQVPIHTPSSGPDLDYRGQYDVCFVLGEMTESPLESTLPVIECDLASQNFLALVGRDVLSRCQLCFDGPSPSRNASLYFSPAHA